MRRGRGLGQVEEDKGGGEVVVVLSVADGRGRGWSAERVGGAKG